MANSTIQGLPPFETTPTGIMDRDDDLVAVWDDSSSTTKSVPWGHITGNLTNAQSYGAVGDGVADDTAAIQAALDDADANNGGRVYLPATGSGTRGRYLISSPLTIGANIELFGDQADYSGSAGGTNIVLADNSNCNMIENKNRASVLDRYSTIHDIYFNGNSGAQTGTSSAIDLLYAKNWKIYRVKMNFILNHGIKLYTSCQENIIENADMMNIDGDCIHLDAAADNLITGCQLTGAGHGIYLTTSGAANNIISNNFIFLCDIGGITLYAGPKGNIVIGNRMNTCVWSGISLTSADGNTICGNYCFDNSSGGTDDAGIMLAGSSQDNTITGNTSKNDATSNQGYGLRTLNTAFLNVIVGNTFAGNNLGPIRNQPHASGNIIAGNQTSLGQDLTFNDATPDVSQYRDPLNYRCTTTTTLTDFDAGTLGQKLLVTFGTISTPGDLTVDFSGGGNLAGNAGVDWVPKQGDAMTAFYDGTNWYCTPILAS